jgi:hypothetical protein
MPHVDFPAHQELLRWRCELQQAQQVRCRGPRAANGVGRLLVRHRELVNQALQTERFLERVEVLALDVLDQRHGQRGFVRDMPDQGRHLAQACHLRRSPAPLAGNDFVTVIADRAHKDRLHEPLHPDRRRQFFERSRVHLRARLVFPGLQAIDRQRPLLLLALYVIARKQGIEAAAESLQFHRAASVAGVTAALPAKRSRVSWASRR